jgi:hypothetical protein
MMKVLRYFETSILTRATRRNIPENSILHRYSPTVNTYGSMITV